MKNFMSHFAGPAFSGKKILFLLAIPLLAAGCGTKQTANTGTPGGTANVQTGTQVQGRAVFSVKDQISGQSPDLQKVTSVKLTIDKLEVHSASLGWVVVSTQPKTFDLLQLKQSGLAQILADAQIAAGAYDQIRIHLTGVTMVKAGVETQAKLPSNELTFGAKIVVNQNGTASVLLDFLADKSLHQTGSGEFLFTPVIKVESKSDAEVRVKSDNSVDVQNGKDEDNETVGTDENGSVVPAQ